MLYLKIGSRLRPKVPLDLTSLVLGRLHTPKHASLWPVTMAKLPATRCSDRRDGLDDT